MDLWGTGLGTVRYSQINTENSIGIITLSEIDLGEIGGVAKSTFANEGCHIDLDLTDTLRCCILPLFNFEHTLSIDSD